MVYDVNWKKSLIFCVIKKLYYSFANNVCVLTGLFCFVIKRDESFFGGKICMQAVMKNTSMQLICFGRSTFFIFCENFNTKGKAFAVMC